MIFQQDLEQRTQSLATNNDFPHCGLGAHLCMLDFQAF
jgi:hypothetical protein